MGIYLRKGSPYWHYDFKISGKDRVRGSTETSDKNWPVKSMMRRKANVRKYCMDSRNPKQNYLS